MEKDVYRIYMYTFLNGKIYIGKTKRTIEERAGINGINYKEQNKPMYEDILKFGWDSIKKETLIENMTNEEARKKEKELIRLKNSIDPDIGYNIQGRKVSEERKERQASKVRTPVNQFTMEGIFIKRWDSITEATYYFYSLTGRIQSICSVCRGKKESAFDFLWEYANSSDKPPEKVV